MTHSLRASAGPWVASFAVVASVLLIASGADAQIKQPGAHARYSVELEPHALLLWRDQSQAYWDNGSGFGLGLRASIPVVQNGFVPRINNNVAIGFGLDWGRYNHLCY